MAYIERFKVVIVAVLGFISAKLGILFVPVMLMVLANITDYSTGLLASVSQGIEISSYKSIKGIIKKIGMWVLVLVGWIMDVMIDYSVHQFGINLEYPTLLACVVAIWIVFSELISIKENVRAMGTDVPVFIDKIQDGMKEQIENKIIMESIAGATEKDRRMEDDLK